MSMQPEEKFLFKLCVTLGYRSIEELKNTMSVKELKKWVLYYNTEPFIQDRIEIQLATLSALIASSNGDKKANPIDYMISLSTDEKTKQKFILNQKEVERKLNDF